MARKGSSALDRQIEQIFYRRCSWMQLNILDIPKVFAAGREAAAAGRDIEAAVVGAVEALMLAELGAIKARVRSAVAP